MKKWIAIILMLCMCLGLSSCLGLKQKSSAENSDSMVSSNIMESSDTKESNDTIENSDIMQNTSWITTGDGSYMVFGDNSKWDWYQNKDELDDNYYSGTYQFYIGQLAMDYITEDLKEYGITVEEMEALFAKNDSYDISNFVCMTALHTSCILDGEEQLKEDIEISYFGFLLKDGTYLDIANMVTGTYYGFEKQQ